MANISDDEKLEIDLILEQRKRKGLSEYLVRWKGSDGDHRGETWEPVKNLTADYAQAIQNFTKSLKTKKTKRSTSRSRKSSRSRSRSSSRSRKAALIKGEAKSQSHGQQKKTETAKLESFKGENLQATRSSRSKVRIVTTVNSISSITKEITDSTQVGSRPELNTQHTSDNKETHSSNMTAQKQLEVQRVHNERCPVRADDLKSRSAIWKVADYLVIVLFALSLIAALFLFLEKFVDLEEFKKQAFPNMGVLQTRLETVQQNLADLAYAGIDKMSDTWLYLIEQVKGTETVKTSNKGV